MPKKSDAQGNTRNNANPNNQPKDEGQLHGEMGQDTSLERGESMQGQPVPTSADPMDTHLMRDTEDGEMAYRRGRDDPRDDMRDPEDMTDEETEDRDLDPMNDDARHATDGANDGRLFGPDSTGGYGGDQIAGTSLEDEENRAQDEYGAGHVMHGVDMDAPSDSGVFGDHDRPETKRRLSGNER